MRILKDVRDRTPCKIVPVLLLSPLPECLIRLLFVLFLSFAVIFFYSQ